MKKFFTQILTAIGFIVALVGIILNSKSGLAESALYSTPLIAASIAIAFVFAKTQSVKIMGHVLSAYAGVSGLLTYLTYQNSLYDEAGQLVTEKPEFDPTIYSIGLIIMLAAALIFVIIEFFSWMGFTRKSSKAVSCDIATMLNQYKALEKEQILSAEEFDDLKSRVLKTSGSDCSSIEDLKKWKKLLDQQVITEEEFSNLKAKAFNK